MLNTKNIPGGSNTSQKVLEPGVHDCTILSITLDKVPYKDGAYSMGLNVMGPDLGEKFEGFYINKDNPDMGRYAGQIAKVRSSEWAYADGTTKSGIKVSRDFEILKFIKTLCTEANALEWLDAQDNQHETIESLVDQFNADKPYKDVVFRMCIAGREYLNKAGYINYDLFLPRASKGSAVIKNVENAEKVMEFSLTDHIKKLKTDKPVDGFNESEGTVPTTASVASSFEL